MPLLLPTRKRSGPEDDATTSSCLHTCRQHTKRCFLTPHTLEGAVRATACAKLSGGKLVVAATAMPLAAPSAARSHGSASCASCLLTDYKPRTQPSPQTRRRPARRSETHSLPRPRRVDGKTRPVVLFIFSSQRRRAAGPDRGPQLVFPPWWFRDQRITIVRLSAALHVARRAERAPSVADGRRRVPGSLAARGAGWHPITRQPWPP